MERNQRCHYRKFHLPCSLSRDYPDWETILALNVVYDQTYIPQRENARSPETMGMVCPLGLSEMYA